MPQIGWFEILIIVVLSILIIGPKDFPIMLKKFGGWLGSFKNYFTEIQKDITDIEDYSEEEIINDKDFSKTIDNKKKDE
jgi:sec-independent protein translocase protein TatB